MLGFVSTIRRSVTPRRRRAIGLETLEPRNLLTGLPLGASPADTAEFMIGRVAVVPVLMESNGEFDPSTEDWTPDLIQGVLDKVYEGVQWWTEALDRLGTAHSLEFVVDDRFAVNPVPTPYEPITRTSQQHAWFVNEFLQEQGFGGLGSLENSVRAFNHDARLRHGTDWAFTIFVVNSTNDEDGRFAAGGEFSQAFAYPGGMYIVMPSTRPASTVTHEIGHMFWARDEYPGGGSWTDRRGYYNAQNLNAADNPTAGWVQEPSIMRAGTPLEVSYANHYLPESTRAMIGWRDTNGNGIFDVADVPLHLEGIGWHDPITATFRFDGFATAVALPNRNSSGLQNDITLNRVDRVEYRLDDGVWQTAVTVDAQQGPVAFELTLGDFSNLELRAIDDRIGVTSPIFAMSEGQPLVAGAAVAGVAFQRLPGEGESPGAAVPTGGITAIMTRLDGPQPLSGAIAPNDFPVSQPLSAAGVELFALGAMLQPEVASVPSLTAPGSRLLGYYHDLWGSWQSVWGQEQALLIRFDTPVGEVQLDAVSQGGRVAYGRIEAFDEQGNRITRATSSGLTVSQSETLTVRDDAARIKSIRAFGHARTVIGFDNLRYGAGTQVTTAADGLFRFAGLPDGDYRLEVTAERAIYQSAVSDRVIEVRAGAVTPIVAEFLRVRSPWNNPSDPFDVNDDGEVTPLDALVVLNEIARNGSRILGTSAPITPFIDTNDDGEVTPLDALIVLNEIARRNRIGVGEGESVGRAADAALAGWFPERETDGTSDYPADLPSRLF
ncbi:MAG: protein containing Planctomycete extracellular domain protein [Planctomycetaceae bacterium]|nr:MAG: protein containing Planctomycete extracellular domain protein [Planctomycetaceae bacterium]